MVAGGGGKIVSGLKSAAYADQVYVLIGIANVRDSLGNAPMLLLYEILRLLSIALLVIGMRRKTWVVERRAWLEWGIRIGGDIFLHDGLHIKRPAQQFPSGLVWSR